MPIIELHRDKTQAGKANIVPKISPRLTQHNEVILSQYCKCQSRSLWSIKRSSLAGCKARMSNVTSHESQLHLTATLLASYPAFYLIVIKIKSEKSVTIEGIFHFCEMWLRLGPYLAHLGQPAH